MDDSSPTQAVAVTQSASASADLAVPQVPEKLPRRPVLLRQVHRAFARDQQCAPNSADGPAASSERDLRQVRHGTVQYLCRALRGSQSSDISQRGLL